MILRIMNSIAYTIDWFQTGASLNPPLLFMNFSSRVFSFSVETILVIWTETAVRSFPILGSDSILRITSGLYIK